MDVGLLMLSEPGRAREIGERAEAAGFAHLALADTQNLGPEVWGQLLLAASATRRIRLGTGVTNPVTRDAAVTASAALALQLESHGRAFCGIGRGDSALAKIGRTPESVPRFESYLQTLRGYLAGESVSRGDAASRMQWSIPSEPRPVPVEVAATGPRVIELAARRADAVVLCVGADPVVLTGALEMARKAAREAGRDPGALRYGAYVNCVVDDDLGAARELARGGISVFARFAGWSAEAGSHQGGSARRVALDLRDSYEMERHAEAGGGGARRLDDAFIDSFAIVGPPSHAARRLQELSGMGLDFVTLAPGSSDMGWEDGWRSIERIGHEVIPALT